MDDNRIRLLRTEKRLKQNQLGDEVGLSQQTVSRIEKDQSKMSVDTLVRLSDYFGVTADYFGVTADYILGISDRRRGSDDRFLKEQKEFEQFHDFFQVYRNLKDRDRELLYRIGQDMRDLKKKIRSGTGACQRHRGRFALCMMDSLYSVGVILVIFLNCLEK